MDYEIAVSEDNQYIRIRVLTDITIDLVERFSRDVSDLCEQSKIKRILSDERGGKSLTNVIETYVFAHKDCVETGLNRSWCVAILKDPDGKEYDCVETVMVNAGFTFKIFDQEDDAIAWLTRE